MTELRNNGHIRVVVEEYIDYLEDGNYHYKVVRLQVRASFLGFKSKFLFIQKSPDCGIQLPFLYT